MPRSCDIDPATGQRLGSSIFPQTLFLGASVISYSVNMGWGGQPSSLSVELINDGTAVECLAEDGITPAIPLFTTREYADNHYYDCVGDDCYVDERGRQYNENNVPPPLQRKIPGKVYYVWTPDKGVVSRYWFDEDPGFFGDYTKIDVAGTYQRSNFFTSYDIIGVPVIFVLDDFIFAGVVQSWEKNIRSNLPTYTVVVEGPDSLLNNSFLILKGYAGSVFSKLNAGSNYGGPLSYIGPEVPNAGKMQEGNLHNVFNVYGFLESMAIDSFGGAGVTDEGISYSAVLDALSVLTSCVDTFQLEKLDKDAFSPFGRILGKVLQENGSYIRPQVGLGFGTLNPTIDPKAGNGSVERNFFTLDLSELPRPPESFKVNGDVISIMDFIRNLTSIVGKDFFTELIPGRVDGKAYNIIKVKVVDRTSQPAQNQISSAISALGAAGYSVEVNGIGQELNDSSSPRVLYIGGKQERLLQVKNYRLGFKQTAYIYNPAIDRLVDFRTFDHSGKIREPVAYSVRNPALSVETNGEFIAAVFDQAEEIHRRLNGIKFPDTDNVWMDNEIGGTDQIRAGNYGKCKKIPLWGDQATNRYIPIYMDSICPFFGYALEDKIEISTDSGSNNFRKIRPVWLDSWTGQINVVCSVNELPPVTMGTSSFLRTASIPSFLNNGYFLISETEMRAAMSGLDSYITYCHAKSVATKPQLYMMLMSAYYYANPAFANNGEIDSNGYGGSFVRTIVGTPIPFLPPENVFIHQANQANNNGLPQANPAQAGEPENKVSRSAFIDPNFIKDLSALCEFVASLGNKFYGQKYMVRIGDIPGYRDRTYADIDIPATLYGPTNVLEQGTQGESIAVFSGTGKIFFSRETCESAWEEPGNVIDDSFVVGSEAWYTLITEQGKIPPLLGYNASDSFDWEARRVCGLRVIANSFRYTERSKIRLLVANATAAGGAFTQGLPRQLGLTSIEQATLSDYLFSVGSLDLGEVLQFDTSYGNMVRFFLTAQGVCSDDKFIFPSLNLGNLSKNDFVLMGTKSPRQDAYGRTISAGEPPPNFMPPILTPQLTLKPFTNPGGMAKKLFLKSQVEGVAFLDPINLRDSRAILSCPGIKLNPPSLNFAIDPTRTVVCNAALEDLIVYLKMTPANNPNQYNQIYVDRLLLLIRGYDLFTTTYTDPATGVPVIGPQSREQLFPNMGYNTNVSKDHATVVAKAAHPYFAAVPIRTNQYSYGPWTNYPKLISNQIFLPGVSAQIANYTNQLNSLTRILSGLQPLSSTYENDRKYLNKQIKIITLLLQRFSTGLSNISSGDAVENLLGAVKVEVDQDLVPWNYGGMAFLDKAVIGLMNSNTDFQQILETAQISINAAPIFGIGGEFTFKDRVRLTGNKFRYNNEEYESIVENLTYIDTKRNPAGELPAFPIPGTVVYLPKITNNLTANTIIYTVLSIKSLNRTGIAPIITNMSTRFDNSGFNTTYSFKTYARKLGLFSKQNSDRLKKAAENTIKFNKNLFSLKNNIITGNIAQTQSRFIDNRDESASLYSVGNLQSKLFGTSPTEVLIGSAGGFLPSKGSMQAQLRMAFPTINRTDNSMILPPVTPLSLTGKDLGDLPVNYNDIKSITSKYRYRSWVGMYQQWETKTELEEGYEEKSAMSLDGLFSPVSFYPTLSNSTYAMLPYPRINSIPICPRCRGDKKIDDTYAVGERENPTAVVSTYACPACSKGMPGIVVDENSVSGVNALNLQPLVVPYAVWRNAHAQPPASGERQRHSIRVVARNWTPPFDPGNGISLDTDKNKEIFKNPSTNKFVENGNGYNIDFHPNDMTKFAQNGGYYPNNQRFFAWRGPLMMHGWGYDVSGFPVPNAADEPKEIDAQGRPKRFKLTSSGTNDYSQEGLFDPTSAQYGLGDIMGKGWERVDGLWTRKPSPYFYLNWAERPDLWPVGPIDLRWDYEKRVWIGGGQGGDCTGNELPPFIIADTNDPELLSKFTILPKGKCAYKSVYVTLEEDMIKEQYYDETYPVRAFIDDIQYSKEPLPNRARRLVFVKDRAGYTAPRGAKLLCRYDNDTGFYEPISKQTYFVFGRIAGGNNAVIDLSYIQGKHRGSNTPTMNITFDNSRFKFEVTANSKGMFYYENGSWILISNNK